MTQRQLSRAMRRAPHSAFSHHRSSFHSSPPISNCHRSPSRSSARFCDARQPRQAERFEICERAYRVRRVRRERRLPCFSRAHADGARALRGAAECRGAGARCRTASECARVRPPAPPAARHAATALIRGTRGARRKMHAGNSSEVCAQAAVRVYAMAAECQAMR